MSVIAIHPYARLGNAMFQWAHAKAHAEQGGHELRTPFWVGEAIFTLDGHPCARPDGTEVETLRGYFQASKDLIYTRADCRRWFKLKPEIERALAADKELHPDTPVAHFRRGDYAGAGFPLISRMSVIAAVAQYFPNAAGIEDISDEHPVLNPAFTCDLEFVPDFYRLMQAPILFRANSSFSWWAATLGHGKIFSPIVDGLVGGIENDNVPYVPGNHPRLAMHEFTTELLLKEE